MVNINVQSTTRIAEQGKNYKINWYEVFNVYNKTVQDINFSEIVCHSFNKGVEHTSKEVNWKEHHL